MTLPALSLLPPRARYVGSDQGGRLLVLAPGAYALPNALAFGADLAGITCSIPGRTVRLTWSGEGPAFHFGADGTGFEGTVDGVTLVLAGLTSDGIKIGQADTDEGGAQFSAGGRYRNLRIEGGRYAVHAVAAEGARFVDVDVVGADVGWYWSADLVDAFAEIGNVGCSVRGGVIEGCTIGARFAAGRVLAYDGTVFREQEQEAVFALPGDGAAVELLRFESLWVEQNNDGRAVGPHGQLHFGTGVTARVAASAFKTPGTGNYHVKIAGAASVDLDDCLAVDEPDRYFLEV